MICKIEKTKLGGKLQCPSNKSYTHRAIFLAALTDGKSIIKNILYSKDTNATIEACKKLGVQIKETENNLTVIGVKESKFQETVIDAENSGTTIRIAAAIASLFDGKTSLSGDESLRQRPMQQLLDALQSMGAKCSSNDGKPPLTVKGKISGGEVTISGKISSQFISALMIAAPHTEKGIILNIEGDLVSKPYVDSTITSMKKFGIRVESNIPFKKYIIPKQKSKPTTFTVPSDFSSLSLLLSASVLLGDKLIVETTMSDLPQGDEAIIGMLETLGVVVTLDKNTITTKSPDSLEGGIFDLSDNPDLLPPLSILALKTSKSITIQNVRHARFKETDRIAILASQLQKLGIKVKERDDGLILNAPDKIVAANLDSNNDHRLFMAFCIAGMYVGNCTVTSPESIEVSYPNFISDMNKVGGKITTTL